MAWVFLLYFLLSSLIYTWTTESAKEMTQKQGMKKTILAFRILKLEGDQTKDLQEPENGILYLILSGNRCILIFAIQFEM